MTVDDRLEHEFKRIVSNLRKDLTNDQNAQKDSNMLFASDLDDSVDPLENLRCNFIILNPKTLKLKSLQKMTKEMLTLAR